MKPADMMITSLVVLSLLLVFGMQRFDGAGWSLAPLVASTAGWSPSDTRHPIPRRPYNCSRTSSSSSSSSSSRTVPSPDNKPSHERLASDVTLLFVVGLDGAGHETFASIAKESPYLQRLVHSDGGLRILTKLQDLLYANGGLFTLHCSGLPSLPYSPSSPAGQCGIRDSVCLYHEIVLTIRQLSQLFHGDSSSIVLPVNANGYGPASMATYPFNNYPCRALEYPVLEYWYQACTEADVKCQHLYLYRPAHQVFWRDTPPEPRLTLTNLQLYTTMLTVLYELLVSHPHRNAGCLNLYEFHNPKDQPSQNFHNQSTPIDNGPPSLLGDVLGFAHHHHHDNNRSASLLNQIWKRVHRPPSTFDQQQDLLIPGIYDLYTENFYRMHELVVQLCRRQQSATAMAEATVRWTENENCHVP